MTDLHLRDWMVRENATIIAVLSIVIAAKLLGDALVSLSAWVAPPRAGARQRDLPGRGSRRSTSPAGDEW